MNDDVVIVPKEWYKSKTYLAAIAGILLALAEGLGQLYGWDTRWVAPVALAVGSIAAIGLRTASRPIGNPNQPLPALPVVASTEAVAVPADAGEVLPPEGVIQPRPEEK